MAIVYCKSCKGKITQRDTVCPRCGSPNSRLVPVLICIVFSAASLMLYNAYRQSATESRSSVASTESVPAAAAHPEPVDIIRMGRSEEE